MPKLTLIDDDYATGILAEHLEYSGFDVLHIRTAVDAYNAIDDIAASDLVILDLIMEHAKEDAPDRPAGNSTTGMSILKQIRKRNANIPVLVYSAINDPDVINAIRHTPRTEFLSKWNTPSLHDFLATVRRFSGLVSGENMPNTFIVHGQDEATKLEVKNYLQNTLELPEPIILHEQPNLGRTIIEKFEAYACQVSLVFILLTPDDRVADADQPDDAKHRARQNVIFELGYFLGSLGRDSGRVILLYKGPLELPSDLSGIVYIDISNGIVAAGEFLRRELAHVLK